VQVTFSLDRLKNNKIKGEIIMKTNRYIKVIFLIMGSLVQITFADQIEIITTRDCVTSSYQSDTNLNGDALSVMNNDAENLYMASLVYFDISSLPSDAVINWAFLSLYSISADAGMLIRIGRLAATPNWSENDVTWNNMPYAETPPDFLYSGIAPNSWNNYDVTDFVEGWYTGSYTNNGFQLFTDSDGTLAMFYPKESGTNVAPKLTIDYSTIPSAPEAEAQTGSGVGEIYLSWSEPSGDVVGYVIVYDEDSSNPPWSPDQDGNPGSGSDVGNVTSVTISGLTPGEEYHLAVAAYNNAGLGEYSNIVTATARSEEFGFLDDFESYSTGSFPSSWIPDANANDISNNYVDASVYYEGSKSLRLHGLVGGCWGALTYHPLNITPPL
jgi:hypothetical protein